MATKMSSWLIFGMGTVMLCGVCAAKRPALPSAAAPLPIEQMLQMKQLPGIRLSGTGRWVAYLVRQQCAPRPGEDFPDGLSSSEIWVADLRTGTSTNVGGATGVSWSPMWSPSGKRLAFYSTRSGAAQIWVWDGASGQSRAVPTTVALDVSSKVSDNMMGPSQALWDDWTLQWMPAEDRLLIQIKIEASSTTPARPPLFRVFNSGSVTAVQPASRETGKPGSASSLALVDIRSGAVRALQTNAAPMRYLLSPDGKHIAYTIFAGNDPQLERQPLVNLFALELKTGRNRALAASIPSYAGRAFGWSPDGSRIAYGTSEVKAWNQMQGNLFVVDLTGGAPCLLTPGEHPSFGDPDLTPAWDADGSSLYLLPFYHGSYRGPRPRVNSLWKVAANGAAARKLLEIPRS